MQPSHIPSVIGFSGRMGAGKTTIAHALARRLTTDTVVTSYGVALKEEMATIGRIVADTQDRDGAIRVAAAAMNVDTNTVAPFVTRITHMIDRDGHNSFDPYAHTDETRVLLQQWGTTVRRAHDPHYWVDCMAATIATYTPSTCVLIDDVRFPNEARLVTDVGGCLIRLDVAPRVQRQRLLRRDGIMPPLDTFSHPSETALDTFPFTYHINTNTRTPNEIIHSLAIMLGIDTQ